MAPIELVADTNVVSYLFKENALGEVYFDLIGRRRTGVTPLSIAELRSGVESDNRGHQRIGMLDEFAGRFVLLPATAEVANLCGTILGRCKRVGRAMKWPDAWAAATAIWLDVPSVTHDRDLEGIPGLQVLTAHEEWRVCEEHFRYGTSGGLWSGESSGRQYAVAN